MEPRGMAALYETDWKEVQNLIPDSEGMSEEQLKTMPPFVRSFRCGRQVETGEPGCGANKFDTSVCPDRRFRTSWHPGW